MVALALISTPLRVDIRMSLMAAVDTFFGVQWDAQCEA
jgi:hypothetical protein